MTDVTHQNLFSASGSQLSLRGTAEIMLEISGLKIPHTFYVCDNLSEQIILGRTFLDDSFAVIDFRNKTITISDSIELPLQYNISRDNFVRAIDSVCIEPNAEVIFPVKCANKFNNHDILLTPVPGEQFNKFAVANAICHVESNKTLCRLLNCTNKCLVICANQKIAQAEMFNDLSQCLLISDTPNGRQSVTADDDPDVDEATLNAFASEYQFNINPTLRPDLRIRLLRILFKRKDAFARTIDDLKAYNKQQFEVHLQDRRPLIQRQFKQKPEHAKILQSILDSWEKCGIVEESTNYHFRNPIFLVPKSSLKTATDRLDVAHYRPVVDLRALNKRVQKLVTFSPSTNDLIQEVTQHADDPSGKGECWYSSFDFLSGFFQLELKPGISRECFSFTAPNGKHLQYRKLPFGFVSSPYYFNQVNNHVTASLKQTGHFSCFMDDALIHTASPDVHLLRIDQYLSILIENGLKCSIKKTFLMQNEIRFLGVDITRQGIKVPTEVNRTIDRLLSLKMSSVKTVQRLCGFLNFWRFHLKNLALRTYNMRQLLRKGTVFQWTDACEKERRDVLQALKTADPLQAIRPNEPIFLLCDSSGLGIGVSVCQTDHTSSEPHDLDKELGYIRRGQPRLKPVMHLSWAFTPAQARLPSTSLELMGLYRALSSIEHLITAREVHVVSDNIGVVAFTKLKFSNPRERRILAFLQQFDLHLHFCSGSRLVGPDMLSRLPGELPAAERVQWTKSTEDDDTIIDQYLFSIASATSEPDAGGPATQKQWKAYILHTEPQNPAAPDAPNYGHVSIEQRPTSTLTRPNNATNPDPTNIQAGLTSVSEPLAHRATANLIQDSTRADRNGTTPTNGQMVKSHTQSDLTTLTPLSGASLCDETAAHRPVHLSTLHCYTPHESATGQAAVASYTDSRHSLEVGSQPQRHTLQPVADQHSTVDVDEQHQMRSDRSSLSCNLNAHARPFFPLHVVNDNLNVDSFHQCTGSATQSDDTSSTSGLLSLTTHITPHDVTDPQFSTDMMHMATVNATKRLLRTGHPPQNEPLHSNADAQQTSYTTNLSETPVVNIPKLTSQNYEQDPEFGDIWRYLTTGELSGDRNRDYRVVLMAPLYIIENDQLFRFTQPRSQKRSADNTIRKVLAIPQRFQESILINLHETQGHPAGQRLFEAARLSIHFKNLYAACFEVAKCCTLCQQVKIDKRKQIPELHPLPIFAPGEAWMLDHKILPRRTPENFTAILVCIDTFSGYTIFEGVRDQTAQTTAEVLIRRVWSVFPNMKAIITDKHQGFMSDLFKCLTKRVLGLSHWSSASYQPQSHGLVENAIKNMSTLLNILAEKDADIGKVLPLAEMISRISISKSRGYSPHEILFGNQPELGLIGSMIERNDSIPTASQYVIWLKERLKKVHQNVTDNLKHARAAQKSAFDKRNKVVSPDWKVGEKVWLQSSAPKARSDSILTHKKFGSTPYFITKVVERPTSADQSNETYASLNATPMAPSYQLANCKTGKVLRYLVPSKRLKRCYDKSQISKLCPSDEQQDGNEQRDNSQQDRSHPGQVPRTNEKHTERQKNNAQALPQNWHRAKYILTKRTAQGKTQFLVKFDNNEKQWCNENDVTEELKRRFILRKAQERNRRQRTARRRFHDN